MEWFSKKPTQQQYINSVVKVATNLYENTLSKENDINTHFEFELNDSRYRYLIFCCSTVLSSVLAYDEKKKVQPDVLYKGCVQFLTWAANEYPEKYFIKNNQNELNAFTENTFQNYLKDWSHWPELELQGKNDEIVDLICKMIRSTESNSQITDNDIKRIGELGLEIDCRMPAMRGAVEEMAGK